jgi:dTDP-4-amino-4,6-dideoxygalactose transaminase
MKKFRDLSDLAIRDARPLFMTPLMVGRPNIGNRAAFLDEAAAILDRGRLTNFGPVVKEFEARLASYLGVRHVVTVSNATVGLEIAARALGLRGEVIIPSFTFIATAHALLSAGLTPVFADVRSKTHDLDPAAVRKAITTRTTGILGVHIWGRGCDVAGLSAVAQEHGLRLFFDAAHAFGSEIAGQKIGNFGDCEVLSFHATKFFNTFEGGAICTNDKDLARRIRLSKNFGFEGVDNVVCHGTNAKMPEICAAMGLANLESLDQFLEINRRNYDAYRQSLADIPGIRLLRIDPTEAVNRQYVVAEVDPVLFGLSRDQLGKICHAENLMVRRYFHPGCHRMEPYKSLGRHHQPLSRTEWLTDRVLVFPTGTQVSPAEVARIGTFLRFVQSNAVEIRTAAECCAVA